MRPIAPPDETLRSGLNEGTCDRSCLWVERRPNPAVRIRSRQLDPSTTFVDQTAYDSMRWMPDAGRQRRIRHVIKDHLAGQTCQQITEGEYLIATHVELNVPT